MSNEFSKNIEAAFTAKIENSKSIAAVLSLKSPHDNIFRDYASRVRIANALDFKKSDVVLDFGTGVGRLAKAYSSKVKSVVGVDATEKMIDYCNSEINKNEFPNLSFQHIKNNQLDFAENTFDKIFTFWVLQHIEDDEVEKLANSFYRIIKSGGMILIAEQVEPKYRVIDDWNIHRPTTMYKEMFERVGFNFIKTEHIFRNPSHGMGLWKKMKSNQTYFLPFIEKADKLLINRKPELVDYFTDMLLFKKP